MYKVTFNWGVWKTPYNCMEDRAWQLNSAIRVYMGWIRNEEKLIKYYPFVQEKIDWRKKENRKLEYFSWWNVIPYVRPIL